MELLPKRPPKSAYGFILLFCLLACATHAQTDTVLSAAPNPFIDSTVITVHNVENDTVTLDVYNRWGQNVAHYYDSVVMSGTFSVTFAGKALPEGVYIAALTLDGQRFSLPLIKDSSAITAIQPSPEPQGIQVVPNPVMNRLAVITLLEVQELELYDLNGKKLMETSQANLDLQGLGKGLYLLHVRTKTRAYIRRIIKL